MMPFIIEHARSVEDAINAAEQGARYIAGGTTLIDLMRDEVDRPERLVNINSLPLSGIHVEDGTLVIGALTRMSEIASHPDVRHLHPVIAESLIEGASPQLRNMASIGGNLLQRVRCPYFRMLDAACNKRNPGTGCAAINGINAGHAILGTSEHCVATHPSDVAVALIALDATVTVRGSKSIRTIAVEDLHLLPGQTPHLEHNLQPAELIIDLRIPKPVPGSRARYLKIRDRSSYEFALVSAAAIVLLENDRISEARLAVGGVGTRPWRLRQCEESLRGRPFVRNELEAAAALATLHAKPLAHNKFKIDLLPKTIVRALELAGEMA